MINNKYCWQIAIKPKNGDRPIFKPFSCDQKLPVNMNTGKPKIKS